MKINKDEWKCKTAIMQKYNLKLNVIKKYNKKIHTALIIEITKPKQYTALYFHVLFQCKTAL